MNKAVFLDRDGTINVDYGYVCEPKKLEFMPGALEALRRIQKAGFLLLIVTNQSGIARGYFSERQYQEFEGFLLGRMGQEGVIVDKVYHCPHGEGGGCSCRKPLTGMFYQAAEEFQVDLGQSYAIGDKARDLSICEKEAVTGILYHEGQGAGSLKASGQESIVSLGSWQEIAEYICAAKKDAPQGRK